MNKLKDTSKVFKIKFLIGTILTVVAILLLAVLFSISLKTSQTIYPVVIVKENIEKGQQITEDMIAISKTKDKNIVKTAAVKLDDVINKYAAVDLVSNSYILPDEVSDNEIYPDTYSNLKDGYVTLSVTFNSFASSMSGKIRKGDIVTVFATKKDNENENQQYDAFIPEELRYVEVVAVTNDSSADIQRKDDNQALETVPTTATLLVTEQQASVLVALEKNGYLHFGLACRNDLKRSEQLLELQKQLIKDKNEQIKKEGVVNE